MESKKIKKEKGTILPADFFGDVCEAKAKPIIKYNYKYGDKVAEIECRPMLSYNEKNSFVRSVWAVYYSPGSNGEYDYRPYMTELAIRYLTVKMYCINVPVSERDDISRYEFFLMNTDFYDELCKHINKEDYNSLIKSVYEYIDRMTDIHSHVAEKVVDVKMREVFESLTKVLNILSDKNFNLDTLMAGDQDEDAHE